MDKLHNFLASVTGQEKVGFIDYSQTSLYVAAAAIAFNPIFWNIVARQGKTRLYPYRAATNKIQSTERTS